MNWPISRFVASCPARSPEVVMVVSDGLAISALAMSSQSATLMSSGTRTIANVGRGTVIDETALLAALDDGRVAYAALDVFEVEPLPASSPLWEHPHVLVSPHTAALSEQEDRRIVRLFADNARRFLAGEPLRNVVDTVEFY